MATIQTKTDIESSRAQRTPGGVQQLSRPTRGGQSSPARRRQGQPMGAGEESWVQGLGWFSIGLGLVEVAAPGHLAKFIGLQDSRMVLRAFGLREITAGLGILTQRRPVGWMWGRVAGDVMDLAALSLALASNRSRREKVMAATAAVVGVTALDVLCSRRLSEQSGMITDTGAVRVQKSMTIDRSPEELYRIWRDFDNLPRWMNHLKSVRATHENRSHWVARAPAGTTVEWDAEITDDRPNELIAWRSLDGGDVDHTGSVRFFRAPAGRGTEVHVELAYRPAGGMVGAAVAKLFGQAPDQQIQEDLRRFKQAMETGEIPTTEGQPSGSSVHAARQ
jgi:uncharacterized membrane protein